MDKNTKLAMREFLHDALDEEFGKSKRSILAGAKKYFTASSFTPDQIKAALAMLMQYLPMLLALLSGK